MEKLEAKFRAGLVSALAFLTVAASVGFYSLPASTHGRMSGVLRTEDGFTVMGVAVFSILCLGSLIALFGYSLLAWMACYQLRWPGLEGVCRSI